MSGSFVNPIFGEREHPEAEVAVDAGTDPGVDSGADLRGTGDSAVDRVVASLDGLDDLPVAEHVAVFEQAHESLRRTLAGAGRDEPAAGRS